LATLRILEHASDIGVAVAQAYIPRTARSQRSHATLGSMNARSRLLVCLGVGVIGFAASYPFTEWQIALLTGWSATSATFIAIVYFGIRGKNAAQTKAQAMVQDDSRTAAEAILVGASIGSLVGVAFALVAASNTHGGVKSVITTLAVVSVVLSWAAVHVVFTLRYARLYYAIGGGINWHSHDEPDFRDFLYIALTIGMTFQVSDTDIGAKPIRMAALRHALLSYLFGVVVVATTINVIATLLTK
jgi:uncharacterized membrane protein